MCCRLSADRDRKYNKLNHLKRERRFMNIWCGCIESLVTQLKPQKGYQARAEQQDADRSW